MTTSRTVPTKEQASRYVKARIFERGGYREAFGGLINKTLPYLLGSSKSLTIGRASALLLRTAVLVLAALFPIIVRKALAAEVAGPKIDHGQNEAAAVKFFFSLATNLSPFDYFLGAIAIAIVLAPKILDVLDRGAHAIQHTPYRDFAAALHQMPALREGNEGDVDKALHLTLSALREELSHLIGEDPTKRTTEVTLLQFCNEECSQMKVRSRTANHELSRAVRIIDSNKLMAFYVAKEGRALAEQDFLCKRNPFPKIRNSIPGNPPVNYRSVLYLPIVTSLTPAMRINLEGPQQGPIDHCVGVICIHSEKSYRFWRWGDHKKGVGGFSDIALHRALPYIALTSRLLEHDIHKVRLEVQ